VKPLNPGMTMDLSRATHAFVFVYDGIVKGMHVDLADADTNEFVVDAIRAGAVVKRVQLEAAKATPLFEPWPEQA
jgi:hypothetical protein